MESALPTAEREAEAEAEAKAMSKLEYLSGTEAEAQAKVTIEGPNHWVAEKVFQGVVVRAGCSQSS